MLNMLQTTTLLVLLLAVSTPAAAVTVTIEATGEKTATITGSGSYGALTPSGTGFDLFGRLEFGSLAELIGPTEPVIGTPSITSGFTINGRSGSGGSVDAGTGNFSLTFPTVPLTPGSVAGTATITLNQGYRWRGTDASGDLFFSNLIVGQPPDNLGTYTFTALEADPPTVPLPAPAVMLLTSLAALAWSVRRRA